MDAAAPVAPRFSVHPSRLRPPAPTPHPRPLGLISLLRVLKKNPIECWAEEHFEEPTSRALGRVVLINEPAAIRRVLLDNSVNYRKDGLQRRVLSAGLANGLLSVESEQWREQRRILAPMSPARR
jgi:cytochrome P450